MTTIVATSCRTMTTLSRITSRIFRNGRDSRLFFVSRINCFDGSARTASTITGSSENVNVAVGEDLYRSAKQVMDEIQQMEARREQEKSQAMYKAWERAQSKGYDSKSQAVQVVKTIAKETRKELKQEQQVADQLRQKHQQAMDMLRRAADEHHHPEASVQLGNILLQEAKKAVRSSSSLHNWNDHNGDLDDDDNAQHQEIVDKIQSSMRLFRQAGESGSRVGWYNLGQIYWTGFPPADEDIVDDDADGILQPVSEEVDERFDFSSNRTDRDMNSNHIVRPDIHEAMECFINAIDLGDHDAMYLVGVHRLTQGGRENYHSGTNLIKRAAEAGHGGALYYLALLYLNGEPHLGLEPCTEEEFVEHLNRAVDAGCLDARFTRGHSYYHGTEGYPQNFKQALDDFLLAADEGHAGAAVSAGAMLHNGVGVLKDQRRAFELYQLAGELGSEEGWMCVVDCWRNGLGVPKSEETAKHIEETMLKKRTKKVDDAKQ